MTGNSFSLGRIFGIEVRLDYSWFIAFGLVTWSLAGAYFPSAHPGLPSSQYWILGAITAVLFFASVLTHELAHSFVSQASGVPVHDITLFVFGGVSQISEEPKTARNEFVMALVGPLTSIAIAVVSYVIWISTRVSAPAAGLVVQWLSTINLSLGLFNLIPGFPLDGGRVLRAAVWGITGNLRTATRAATTLGRLIAYGFTFYGLYLVFTGSVANGIWIAFIGFFLENAATRSMQQQTIHDLLSGHKVREAMTTDCPRIQPNLTLDVLVDTLVMPSGKRCFPVEAAGKVEGLVTLHGLRRIPRDQWPNTRVEQVMVPNAQLKSVKPDDDLMALLERMTSDDVNQYVVKDNGELVGMIARDNLLQFIRTRSELGALGKAHA